MFLTRNLQFVPAYLSKFPFNSYIGTYLICDLIHNSGATSIRYLKFIKATRLFHANNFARLPLPTLSHLTFSAKTTINHHTPWLFSTMSPVLRLLYKSTDRMSLSTMTLMHRNLMRPVRLQASISSALMTLYSPFGAEPPAIINGDTRTILFTSEQWRTVVG